MADDLFASRRTRRAKNQDQDGGAPSMTQEEKERALAVASCERHLSDLQTHPNVKLIKDTDLHFQWVITPQEGYWKGGSFVFDVVLPNNFPYSSPIVVCRTPIWHPNIDTEGKPCVSVLQKGWRPTHALNYLMYGLLFLFDHPNSEDPLNVKAAEEMRTDLELFKKNVIEKLKKAKSMNDD